VNEYNDGNWLGNLYTFDGRVSTEVGDAETHTTIGECLYTGEKTDNCENCRYAPCNARIIATEKSFRKHMGFCSRECYEWARNDGLIKDVEWDKLDYKNVRKETDGLGKIAAHLDRKLANIEWSHATSQKEGEVVEC
jgi:predicted sulfurtransferase